LSIVSLLFANGFLVISLAYNTLNQNVWMIIGVLVISWFIVHFIIRYKIRNGDPFLLPLAIYLCSIGLIMIYRLKPEAFLAQSLWVFFGLIAFLLSALLFHKFEDLDQYQYVYGMIGIGLLLATILFGVEIGGNKNWIILGPIRFQPSEFAKIFIVLFLASFLQERCEILSLSTHRYGPFNLPQPRFIAPLFVFWGLAMVMLVIQRDLGSALLYFGLVIIMMYMGSGRSCFILIGSALFLIGSFTCFFLYPHVHDRIDIWLNPWLEPNGAAYQIIQSLFALGSGGLLGSGLTSGFPTLIPEVHTDFIFSAIGEEFGFVGSSAVMIAYIILIYRAFLTSLRAPNLFYMLVAGGLGVCISLQVIIIVGGVSKFLPLTGITLPMISYGGSSMVASFILLGILFWALRNICFGLTFMATME
jgi:peptidoglycan glycosyltransferase